MKNTRAGLQASANFTQELKKSFQEFNEPQKSSLTNNDVQVSKTHPEGIIILQKKQINLCGINKKNFSQFYKLLS